MRKIAFLKALHLVSDSDRSSFKKKNFLIIQMINLSSCLTLDIRIEYDIRFLVKNSFLSYAESELVKAIPI